MSRNLFLLQICLISKTLLLNVGLCGMTLILPRNQKLNGRAKNFLIHYFEYATVAALKPLFWHLFLLTYENKKIKNTSKMFYFFV